MRISDWSSDVCSSDLLPQMQDVSSDLQIRSPQALIDIDREKATTLGVSADAVRNTLYSAFGDRQVSTIYTPTNEYEVILEVLPRYQENPSSLKDIYVRANDGHLVPLDAVAHIKRNVGPSTVNHQGQPLGRASCRERVCQYV